jgi:signal transduction histidine kinase
MRGRAQTEAADAIGLFDELDAQYMEALSVLDQNASYRWLSGQVRELVGVDVAWVGVPHDDGTIVLRAFVGARAGSLNGVVVPIGQGLGGQVLASHRPRAVREYMSARSISHQFDTQVQPEGLSGMMAVPMMIGDRMCGILYGANRRPTSFGDRAIGMMTDAATRGARAILVAERARHLAEVAVYEERKRLAVEPHDTVGAMLFTITAHARGLSGVGDVDPALRQRLVQIEERAAEAAEKLRESLRVLHASPQEVELGVALRSDCHSFEERTGLPARVIMGDIPSLHPSRAKALVESVREALLNVEKHARASSVVVTVCTGDGGVYASVVDDGVGLGKLKSEPGLGLEAASERLERLGGRLRLTQSDEGGSTFRAWVPT